MKKETQPEKRKTSPRPWTDLATSQASKLVVLKLHHRKPTPHVVAAGSQEDLEELLLRRRRAVEAQRYAEIKEESIAAALCKGAQVEYGVHAGELVTQHRLTDGGRESVVKLLVL